MDDGRRDSFRAEISAVIRTNARCSREKIPFLCFCIFIHDKRLGAATDDDLRVSSRLAARNPCHNQTFSAIMRPELSRCGNKGRVVLYYFLPLLFCFVFV